MKIKEKGKTRFVIRDISKPAPKKLDIKKVTNRALSIFPWLILVAENLYILWLFKWQ